MIDVHSTTWAAIVDLASTEIAKSLQALKKDQDETSTTRTRERIRAFEDVLTWATPIQEPPIDEGTAWRI